MVADYAYVPFRESALDPEEEDEWVERAYERQKKEPMKKKADNQEKNAST